MSNFLLTLFPFCANCGKIEAKEGDWVKQDGTPLTTTQKLDACGRCFMARYCGKECQEQHHPQHNAGCLASTKPLTRVEIDRVVSRVLRARPGAAQLYIDESYKVRLLKQSQGGAAQNYLKVDLQIGDQNGGTHTYMVCKRAPCEPRLPEALEEGMQKAGEMTEQERLGLAQIMVNLGFYHKVYSLVLTFSNSSKMKLFETAAYKMIEKDVEHADLVRFGKRLGRSDAEILKVAVKVYALNGKAGFAKTLFENQTNASFYLEIMRSALADAGRAGELKAL